MSVFDSTQIFEPVDHFHELWYEHYRFSPSALPPFCSCL